MTTYASQVNTFRRRFHALPSFKRCHLQLQLITFYVLKLLGMRFEDILKIATDLHF